jgi:hypothetical protein
MKEGKDCKTGLEKHWYRIPNGTKVRHRLDGNEGVIDGLTEIVSGSHLNADGRTQYRIHGTDTRGVILAAEADLLFLADHDGLVMIQRESVGYRRYVTDRLRSLFTEDRFVV